MATRKALVLIGGKVQELPAGDTLIGATGGNVPAGAAVMSDAVAFSGTASLADAIAAKTDVLAFAGTYAMSEAQDVKSDALRLLAAGPYDDLIGAKADTLGVVATAWAAATATSGTAPTNPANATGQQNATTAGVKAGGLAAGTSQLVLSGFVTPSTGGAPTLALFYSATPGSTDTFTVAYTFGGVETVLHSDATARAFLTTPEVVTLPAGATKAQLDAVSVRFTHAATLPGSGGTIAVDAAGIRRNVI